MSYYDESKTELENLLKKVQEEKLSFEKQVESEKRIIEQRISWYEKLRTGIEQMAKQRQMGFPWLASAYEELFQMRDAVLADFLKNKKYRAVKSGETLATMARECREAFRRAKILEHL